MNGHTQPPATSAFCDFSAQKTRYDAQIYNLHSKTQPRAQRLKGLNHRRKKPFLFERFYIYALNQASYQTVGVCGGVHSSIYGSTGKLAFSSLEVVVIVGNFT